MLAPLRLADTNKDGNIDEEEALQLAEKVGIDKEHAQSRWAEVKAGIDLNKDGKLSREGGGVLSPRLAVWNKPGCLHEQQQHTHTHM